MITNSIILIGASLGDDLYNKGQDVALTFGVDTSRFIGQLIIFIILYVVLKKYAFDPILNVLEERKNKIQESVENAEKIKKELADAEAQRAEIIRKANEQAATFIDEAKQSAETVGQKKVQEATAEAEALIKKAQEAAAMDRDKMMADLKKEVGKMVVSTTSKVVGKVLTKEDEERLQKEAVGQL